MNRIKKRAVAVLLLVAVLFGGVAFYSVRYAVYGGDWVSFSANRHGYSGGVLLSGKILDRNGEVLCVSEDGKRAYNENGTVRRATLHIVGDVQGNIGTSILKRFSRQLMGYNIINGVYSFNKKGSTLNLTVDSSLCATAYEALNGRKGTVAVYNYKTGDVLCMVSTPSFDPKAPISAAEAEKYDGIYLNRAISSTFAPGSIFKLVTLAAAIDHIDDLFSQKFTCKGQVEIGGEVITCLHRHGTINIQEALAGSCNVAFSELAQQLGPELLSEYAVRLGLCDTHEISGIKTAKGNFEAAAAGSASLSWAGIGQYNDLVNPMAVLRFMGAVAGGGKAAEPRIIKSIYNAMGLPSGLYLTDHTERMLSEQTAGKIAEMMRYNVTAEYGQSRFGALGICAKSGTAEVGSGKSPHSWFVGFLNDADNPLAFVVFIENGGSGSSAAGSVAASVMKAAVAD